MSQTIASEKGEKLLNSEFGDYKDRGTNALHVMHIYLAYITIVKISGRDSRALNNWTSYGGQNTIDDNYFFSPMTIIITYN